MIKWKRRHLNYSVGGLTKVPTWQSFIYLCEFLFCIYLSLKSWGLTLWWLLQSTYWFLFWNDLEFFFWLDASMQIEMRGVPIVAHWTCLCEGKLSHTWTNEKSVWWAVCIAYMGSKPVWLHLGCGAKADDLANTSNESCGILGTLLGLVPSSV
jgi:hypothetical protein